MDNLNNGHFEDFGFNVIQVLQWGLYNWYRTAIYEVISPC